MSTIRPELSSKNKWHINRYRYYELKYFCLQYDIYKQHYYESRSTGITGQKVSTQVCFSDPTWAEFIRKNDALCKMKLIEQAALATDPDLASYILEAVTKERSYTYLRSLKGMPCGKNTYYDRYRKFFYILDASFSTPLIE